MIVSACVAVFCAVVFFMLATGHGVYAPGARKLQQDISALGGYDDPILSGHRVASIVYLGLRKLYGAIAFAILGFLTAPVFPRSKRIVGTAVLLGTLRAAIEVVERVLYHSDSTLESVADTLTGAGAGALGALAFGALVRKREDGA
jgi:hypothetical protein